MDRVEDVYEPLEAYRDRFREAFAQNAKALFDRLLAESGVDGKSNARTMKDLAVLEKHATELGGQLSCWRMLATVLWIGAAISFLLAGRQFLVVRNVPDASGTMLVGLLLGIGFAVLALVGVHPQMRAFKAAIGNAKSRCQAKRDEGLRQMAPLADLFDWDTVARLAEQTVPRISMDRRFDCGRLRELREVFGWDEAFHHDKSIVDVQSGEINGNPFALVSTLERSDGIRTYTGHLDISWRECVHEGNGQDRWETRNQTLTASLDRFIPVYTDRRYLVYGCEAAPDLSFSRTPGRIPEMKDNVVGRFLKRRTLRQLERKAAKLGRGDFTLMANEDFDILFHAVDRDNEHQFRLLFTPLAQQQMVALLEDGEVGFGDDFTFTKRKKINIVTAEHLDRARLDTDPSRFRHHDLKEIRRRFLIFANAYFKAFYFAMAPLLAIPLYQQIRSRETFRRMLGDDRPSSWEYEALANFEGEKLFRHPDTATRSILRAGGITPGVVVNDCSVDITAYGYKAVPRLSHVEKRGRDGNDHKIPVEWVEYIPVQRTVPMAVSVRPDLKLPDFRALVRENAALREAVSHSGLPSPGRHFRRNLIAFVDMPSVPLPETPFRDGMTSPLSGPHENPT